VCRANQSTYSVLKSVKTLTGCVQFTNAYNYLSNIWKLSTTLPNTHKKLPNQCFTQYLCHLRKNKLLLRVQIINRKSPVDPNRVAEVLPGPAKCLHFSSNITLKIPLMTYKALSGIALSYLKYFIVRCQPKAALFSLNAGLFGRSFMHSCFNIIVSFNPFYLDFLNTFYTINSHTVCKYLL